MDNAKLGVILENDMYENETVEELRDVLRRNGFVPCDIAACNCGSWHPRYGLQERWEEIKEAVSEAGHPLCNDNGHILLNAIKELIAERDKLHDDAMTMALRLLGENEDSFAPETREVMSRWRDKCMVMLSA